MKLPERDAHDDFKALQYDGEVYEEIEDYENAAKYYLSCFMEGTGENEYIIKAGKSLGKMGLRPEEIDKYINEVINGDSKMIAEPMALMWEELGEWDLALRYFEDKSADGKTGLIAKSLFFRGNYEACFKELNKNISLLSSEKYVVMALCCILMERRIQSAFISDLIVKVKRNEFIKPLYTFNFFAYNQDIKCDKDSIMDFCRLLLKTADPGCIKYVRLALDHIKDMDFKELAKISFENGLYYFSEEIINLYGREHKNDYDILCLLANIYYYTGNISECEKYVSNALVISESKELIKLACLCKLKECGSIISRYKTFKNVKSIKSFMEKIEECEKILVP